MKHIVFFICAILLYSCGLSPKFSDNNRLRYDDRVTSVDNLNFLKVNLAVLPIPKVEKKEKEKTFFDLTDSVKLGLFKVLDNNTNSNKEILEIIKMPFSDIKSPKGEESLIKDKLQFQVRILLSNIKKYYNNDEFVHPNTRIEILNTYIGFGNDVEIISVDKLENEFETIDLGTLERTASVQFNTKLSGEIGSGNENSNLNSITSEGTEDNTRALTNLKKSETFSNSNKKSINKKLNASVDFTNSDNLKEAINLKFKKAKISFSISDKIITVSQKGFISNDISDNIILTVTLKLNNGTRTRHLNLHQNLFDSKSVALPFDSVNIKKIYKNFYDCQNVNNLKIDFGYEGMIRVVRNNIFFNGSNVLEYDDKVRFYKFSSVTSTQSQKDKPNSDKNKNDTSTQSQKDKHNSDKNKNDTLTQSQKDNCDSFTFNPCDNIKIKKFDFCDQVFRIKAIDNKKKEYYLKTFEKEKESYIYFDTYESADEFINWILEVIKLKEASKLKSKKYDYYFIDKKGKDKIQLLNLADFNTLDSLNFMITYDYD